MHRLPSRRNRPEPEPYSAVAWRELEQLWQHLEDADQRALVTFARQVARRETAPRPNYDPRTRPVRVDRG